MSDIQAAKAVVRSFYEAVACAGPEEVGEVLSIHTAPGYIWRGMHPFYEQHGARAVADVFWGPLLSSWTSLQRRQDIFLAGYSETDGTLWVASMGHFIGLRDGSWLGIPATRKLATLRYAEFSQVVDGKISQSAMFCDIVSVMLQAGIHPLPVSTGVEITIPGPRSHDGLQFDACDPAQARKTLDLVNRMKDDLARANASPPDDWIEVLGRTWHPDMLWFGPSGIGSTYTIERYRQQHQAPFRDNLENIRFNGHVCRIAEGPYAAWFGWPNLTMKSRGGFLGLPRSDGDLHMRIVDIYRRDGDKLAENWIFIDLLYWMQQQGVDVLERVRKIAGSH